MAYCEQSFFARHLADNGGMPRSSKFTCAQDIIDIRASTDDVPVLAARYGCSEQSIRNVIDRRTFAYIRDPDEIPTAPAAA